MSLSLLKFAGQESVFSVPTTFLTYFRRAVLSTPSNREYVFVIGAPRSGTTLLKSLIVSHSQYGSCDYEGTLVFAVRDLRKYRLKELTDDDIVTLLNSHASLVSFYNALTNEVLSRNGGAIFVDKVSMNWLCLQYVVRLLRQSKFVNIVRDGRDVFCSAREHPNIPQAATPLRFARYWKKCVKVPSAVVPRTRLLNVQYEHLVASPAEQIAEVMKFLGNEFEDEQVTVEKYSETTELRHTEQHRNLGKQISARSVGRWRAEMSEEEQGTFIRIAGYELHTFGYLD